MSITSRWENPEKTIIYQKFEGNWEIDDLINGFDEIYAMLDSVSHPVNVITDMSAGKAPMSFLSRFPDINEASYANHPNTDRFFVVGTTRFVEMMANSFTKFGGLAGRLFIVDTIDEAYDMIESG
ncbi:MAG: hypothetical protein JXJ17_01470 [Anaerolineae bacterium]|nr:hypothetical protein [Anaerolineae bacterium]